MDELVGVLGRERVLLERLVYRLTGLRDLLAAGEVRFLGWAAYDVEQGTERVRRAELHRALAVSAVAERLVPDADGLPLAALAACAGEPWRTVLREHRAALLRLTAEVDALTAQVRTLAERGRRRVAGQPAEECGRPPGVESPFLRVSVPARIPVVPAP